MRASVDSGGKSLSQHSQPGLLCCRHAIGVRVRRVQRDEQHQSVPRHRLRHRIEDLALARAFDLALVPLLPRLILFMTSLFHIRAMVPRCYRSALYEDISNVACRICMRHSSNACLESGCSSGEKMKNNEKRDIMNIGAAGFNTIETIGLRKFLDSDITIFRLHHIRSPKDVPLMNGSILSTDVFDRWQNLIDSEQNLLIVGKTNIDLIKHPVVNLTLLDSDGDAVDIRNKISRWITKIAQRSSSMQNNRGRTRRFSEREVQILRCLTIGATNEQIASQLQIKETTVKTHLRRIYERLGAVSRAHAVALYKELD